MYMCSRVMKIVKGGKIWSFSLPVGVLGKQWYYRGGSEIT